MAGTAVTIAGTTYYVPVQSEDPAWGDDLHDTVVALANSVGSANLAVTSFTLLNNQSAAVNVTSLAFNTGTIRGFKIDYSIYISTTLNEYSETGTLYGAYLSTAGTWNLSQVTSGSNSGVTFSITSGGQIQYQTTSVSGSSYSGKLKYITQTFLQA